MRDYFTCEFAERKNNGEYIDMCSGSGNCDYEKYRGVEYKPLYKILEEILMLAKSELNENKNIGYTMPNGEHHLYIYIDDSMGKDKYFYTVEPNRMVNNGCEPMGNTIQVDYNDFASLLIGCIWCIEHFFNYVE